MTILLTGSSGFVGRAILKYAQESGFNIRPVFRTMSDVSVHTNAVFVQDLNARTDWALALKDVKVVIHVASIPFKQRKETLDMLNNYRKINVDGTLNLARQAAEVGVRRFIFISSIKVNGENTRVGYPFTADGEIDPQGAYALSKSEAELQLKQVANETGMELTIIRPPMIYGPGVKGNMFLLVRCIRKGLPLPLASVTKNRRSLVSIDNLVDLIVVCINHPKAANQTFLISDGEDLSTSVLLKKIGNALGKPAHLFFFPTVLLSLIATLIGLGKNSERLLGSLQVDIKSTCEILNWSPSLSMDEALRRSFGGF